MRRLLSLLLASLLLATPASGAVSNIFGLNVDASTPADPLCTGGFAYVVAAQAALNSGRNNGEVVSIDPQVDRGWALTFDTGTSTAFVVTFNKKTLAELGAVQVSTGGNPIEQGVNGSVGGSQWDVHTQRFYTIFRKTSAACSAGGSDCIGAQRLSTAPAIELTMTAGNAIGVDNVYGAAFTATHLFVAYDDSAAGGDRKLFRVETPALANAATLTVDTNNNTGGSAPVALDTTGGKLYTYISFNHRLAQVDLGTFTLDTTLALGGAGKIVSLIVDRDNDRLWALSDNGGGIPVLHEIVLSTFTVSTTHSFSIAGNSVPAFYSSFLDFDAHNSLHHLFDGTNTNLALRTSIPFALQNTLTTAACGACVGNNVSAFDRHIHRLYKINNGSPATVTAIQVCS